MNTCELKAFVSKIRGVACDMVLYRGDGHISGVLSMSDVLAVLFGNYMKEEDWFVLSREHVGSAYYAILMLADRLDQKRIHTLNENDTSLPSHPDRMKTPGIQVTTGFPGQGTSQATGIAYTLKMTKREGNMFRMIGDGERSKGEVFEVLQLIANKRLDNCIVMVDCDKKQIDSLLRKANCDLGFPALLQSIGFHVCKVDEDVAEAINGKLFGCIKGREQAGAFLLNTVRGAGIPYFE